MCQAEATAEERALVKHAIRNHRLVEPNVRDGAVLKVRILEAALPEVALDDFRLGEEAVVQLRFVQFHFTETGMGYSDDRKAWWFIGGANVAKSRESD